MGESRFNPVAMAKKAAPPGSKLVKVFPLAEDLAVVPQIWTLPTLAKNGEGEEELVILYGIHVHKTSVIEGGGKMIELPLGELFRVKLTELRASVEELIKAAEQKSAV